MTAAAKMCIGPIPGDAAIRSEGCGLDRARWHHPCGTTHCRGGWAIVKAGQAGKDLEDAIGSNAAAALIYNASRPGRPVPDFYAGDEAAMADLEACAAEAIAEGGAA